MVRDEVELSDEEFSKFVMNDWEWKRTFIQSSTKYLKADLGNLAVTSAVKEFW